MRPAASAWEEHYAAILKNEGHERGRAAPTAFTNKETGVRVVVWVDDFTFLGRDRYLKEIGAKIDEWYGGDHQLPRERQAGPPVSGEHAGTNDGEAYNTKLIQPQEGG